MRSFAPREDSHLPRTLVTGCASRTSRGAGSSWHRRGAGPYSDQCPRATPSTTRRTRSARCWRARCRTSSPRRTRASGATAGRAACRPGGHERRRARQAPVPALRGRAGDPLAPAHDRQVARARPRDLARPRATPGCVIRRGEHAGRPDQRPGARADDRLAHALRPAARAASAPTSSPPSSTRQRVPAPAARGRPDAPDRRRPARPAHHRRASATCGRSRAASRPASTRGGAPATSPTRRRWRSSTPPARGCRSPRAAGCRSASRSSTASPAARARAAATPRHPCTRAGRRQPDDILVPTVSALRRIGHKGADLIVPGNTPASFDAALAHGVDMIEFDVLPENQHAPDDGRLLLAHDYEHVDGAPTLEEGLAHLASAPVRRRRARRRPQAPRLRGAGGRRAARARPGRALADLDELDALAGRRSASSSRSCGSAGRSRA